MCNHGADKKAIYLPFLSHSGYEIYMCECGALINMQDTANLTWASYIADRQKTPNGIDVHAMSSSDLESCIKSKLKDFGYELASKINEYCRHGID